MKFYIETIFEQSDLDHLHDVYFDATLTVTGEETSLNEEQILELWERLDDDIKFDAMKWGLSDTCVRDNIWEFVKNEYENGK